MIIAITTNSRSRSSKLCNELKKAMSNQDTMTAGFRYPVVKIAKMFGWDGRYDERGKKLINTLYSCGIEYDKDIWVKKMEKLVKKTHVKKKTIIISDIDSKKQVDMLNRIDSVRLIVCGDNAFLEKDGLIDIFVESDKPIEEVVAQIMKRIK
ncbi:MAG: hypothetical protein Q8M92_02255 [Candidatus Subteraquimicrobiales bacterium]|nr:hypothetical protein [Candidatus Subteraquimicrobiales bacterium]